MKNFLSLVLMTSSFGVIAADRDIFDIMYLPDQGTVYGFSEFNNLDGKIDNKDAGDTEFDGYQLNQTVGYALSDRLSIDASLNYRDVTYDPGKTYDETGISDPTLRARYRILDEDFKFDLLAGGLVSFGDSKTKSNGDEDNRTGGHELFIGGQIGQKTDNLQWAFSALYTRFLEATTDDKSNLYELEEDSHNNLKLQADLLNKIGAKSFIRSSLGADFTPGYDVETNEGGEGSVAAQTQYDLGVEYQYLAMNNVLLRVGGEYNKVNTNSGSIKNFDFWVWRIAANYEF